MNRRTFLLLSGAASGSLLVPLRESAGWVPEGGRDGRNGRDARLGFEFDGRHRWSLWYREEGAAVPLLPFASAGVRLEDRLLTLGDLDDVSVQAGTPPVGESTVIRGRGAGLFVEATFLIEPATPAPRASITLRIYPDTSLPVVSGLAWASLPVARVLPGSGDLLAQVDDRDPAIVPVSADTPELQSIGTLALTRRPPGGPARTLAVIQAPGGAGALHASFSADQLAVNTDWTPGRPVSTGGDVETVTFCYQGGADGVSALAAACEPASGDREYLASLEPPTGLWLSGSEGRGDDLFDLLGRATALLDPRFARFVAYGPGDGSPRGHRWCTDQIHAAGLLAAVSWTAFKADDGTALDPADPSVRAVLRERARVAVQDWGYDALILDASDAAPPPSPSRGNLTRLEALRAGFAAIHEGAGSATIWSSTLVPQTGTINVVRVGDPPAPGWHSIARMAVTAGLRSFYHRSLWLNDPGPMTLGYPLTLLEARCQLSLSALMGAATTFTSDVLDVPDAQVDLVRRVVPPAAVAGHPLDALDATPPSLWMARAEGWYTALVINWEDHAVVRGVRLADLGLPRGSYHAYDVWRDTPVPGADPLRVSLNAHDCLVLGLRVSTDHPQVIGTSRHIVQGCVDLQDEHWDGRSQTLSGRAVTLDGRPYRVTVAAPGWTPDALTGERPGTVRVLDSEYVVLEWPGGERRDFTWQVSFRRARRAGRPRPH